MRINHYPTITIVTPVLNACKFIESCILSVLSQSYSNIEYIIIDGGSTDGTKEIIESYSNKLAYWESKPDRGQSHALNKGFSRATGQIFGWLNADEEYLPGVLNRVASEFAENPHLDFLYGYRLRCNANGTPIRVETYPNMKPLRLSFWRGAPSDASFWSKRVHMVTGKFDEENFQHLSMDYDWFLRLSLNIRQWKRLPYPLSKFKDHPCRKTSIDSKEERERLWKMARDHVFKELHISKSRLALETFLVAIIFKYHDRSWTIPKLSTIKRLLGL